jgi:hyaluronan synthase
MNDSGDTFTVAVVFAAASAGALVFPGLLTAVVLSVTVAFLGWRWTHRSTRTHLPTEPQPELDTASLPPSPTHWRVGWVVAAAVLAVLVVYRVWTYNTYGITYAAIYFTAVSGAVVLMFVLAARGFDRLDGAPPVPGRIVAVIPTYNEDNNALHAAVRSLLNSTIVPDEIHIIDDGSLDPVVPFTDPRVTWHRQDNEGKRAAQTSVLRHYSPDQVDFIVTVDSDSHVAPTAIEDALRAFNDPQVMAVTSVVLIRNRADSLLALLSDMEIVTGVFTVRRGRAAVGAVTPTSGAFSIYRSAPVLDNLDDYVASGTFSDDRRLAHYCLLRGKVVSVNGAVVDTDMPTTYRGIWRQRVRWYKGYWKYLGWEAAHLNGWALRWRYLSTLSAAVFPLALAWVCLVMPLTGRPLYWPVFVLWLGLMYAQSLTYLRRPFVSRPQAWACWLFLSPLLIPFQLLLVRPAMYWAAITVRSERWDGHRENDMVGSFTYE